jgi:hypothetical protein
VVNYLINIDVVMSLLKLKLPKEIDMSPGNGRDTLDEVCFFKLSRFFCLYQERGKNECVAENNAVGKKPCTLAPDILFQLCFNSELSLVLMKHCPLQFYGMLPLD